MKVPHFITAFHHDTFAPNALYHSLRQLNLNFSVCYVIFHHMLECVLISACKSLPNLCFFAGILLVCNPVSLVCTFWEYHPAHFIYLLWPPPNPLLPCHVHSITLEIQTSRKSQHVNGTEPKRDLLRYTLLLYRLESFPFILLLA